jgi:PIG-X / PBN1
MRVLQVLSFIVAIYFSNQVHAEHSPVVLDPSSIIKNISEEVTGAGFHLQKSLSFHLDTQNATNPLYLGIFQRFPNELFIDRFQLPRFYNSPYLEQQHLLGSLSFFDVALSIYPHLEAPSSLASPFDAFFYFSLNTIQLGSRM